MSVRAAAAVELHRRAHQQAYCGGQRGAVSAALALLRLHRTLARASGAMHDLHQQPRAVTAREVQQPAGAAHRPAYNQSTMPRTSQFSNPSIVAAPMVEILKKQEPTSNVYRRNTACWMRRKNTA
ncbi:hypothetical protein AB1Y20_009889 [Prymnesium parvum]|uniref:Uncharacterized protein n=1 Tax=Prymnesium parvum TaxID=97485 RepID=A0AB34IYC0_PRYPA